MIILWAIYPILRGIPLFNAEQYVVKKNSIYIFLNIKNDVLLRDENGNPILNSVHSKVPFKFSTTFGMNTQY